jgi:integrase
VAQGRAAGRTVRVTIGRADHLSCDQARVLAKARLGDLASNKDVNAEKKLRRVRGATLEVAFAEFRKNRASNKARTLNEYERQLERYLSDWKGKPWTSITRHMISQRHQEIGSNNGQRTANNVMRGVRSILNFCRAKYRHPITGEPLLAENPVRVLSDQKSWYHEKAREDFLKPSELGAWWAAIGELANETQRDYLYTLLLTGCRAMEVATLRWSDVSLKDRTLTVLDTKNGTTHRLPICNYLHDLLVQRHEKVQSNFEFVFPASSKRPSKSGHVRYANRLLERVANRAGVEMRSRHGLRRTFASVGESLGIGTFTLKRLMNHTSGASSDITSQYAKLAVEQLRTPVDRIAEFVLKCAGVSESAAIIEFPKFAAQKGATGT